ncbi:hypothetical protein Trydic_g14435 [Trypoxylus dichotomus]
MGQNKAIVAAVPKPGKHREDPRSYRLIALLCCPLKLYKRMILSKIRARVESRLIPQICFRPGKSCINQVLNLTQYTGQRLKTDVAFTDISSAYNTVNVNRLLNKVYNTTTDQHLTKVTRTLPTNRSTSLIMISPYGHKLGAVVNVAYPIITGYLRATNQEDLFMLSGIAPTYSKP